MTGFQPRFLNKLSLKKHIFLFYLGCIQTWSLDDSASDSSAQCFFPWVETGSGRTYSWKTVSRGSREVYPWDRGRFHGSSSSSESRGDRWGESPVLWGGRCSSWSTIWPPNHLHTAPPPSQRPPSGDRTHANHLGRAAQSQHLGAGGYPDGTSPAPHRDYVPPAVIWDPLLP